MRRRARAGMAILHLRLVRLHVGDELLQRVGRKVLRHDDDARRLDHEAERREVGERVVGRILVERLAPGVGAAVADHELRAVGRRLRHAQRADRAAGADRIFHHHVLAEHLGEALRDDASGHVARPARSERHDQGERAAPQGLRRRGRGQRGDQRRRGAGQCDANRDPQHDVLASGAPASLAPTRRQ